MTSKNQSSRGAGSGEVRVLIAEDHRPLRMLFARLLAQQEGFHIVGVAADGEEAVKLARELRPDVLLLDLSMPRLDGLTVLRQLARELPATRLIAWSMHSAAEMASIAREAGATAYVDKSRSFEEIVAAIREQAKELPKS